MARSMEIHCRPLDRWPRELTQDRKRSPFKTPWEGTLRLLKAELRKLDATTVVVQVAFPEREISVTTGWPRADRTPAHPGVIVAADTRYGALKWVCDACTRWTANVHAIGLTLERLRLADLYGVTSRGEQYAGWKMLPGPITAAGPGAAAPAMSIEEAARFVAQHGGRPADAVMRDRATWRAAYRAAALKLHSDHNRGVETEDWRRLQDARRLLDGLHNGR